MNMVMENVITPFLNSSGLSPQAELLHDFAKVGYEDLSPPECNAIMHTLHVLDVTIQSRLQETDLDAHIFGQNMYYAEEYGVIAASEASFRIYEMLKGTPNELLLDKVESIVAIANRDGYSFVRYAGTIREEVWANTDGSAKYVFCCRDTSWIEKSDPDIQELADLGAARKLKTLNLG
jgi:hypothetical protein